MGWVHHVVIFLIFLCLNLLVNSYIVHGLDINVFDGVLFPIKLYINVLEGMSFFIKLYINVLEWMLFPITFFINVEGMFSINLYIKGLVGDVVS